jgi:hypothetical protein
MVQTQVVGQHGYRQGLDQAVQLSAPSQFQCAHARLRVLRQPLPRGFKMRTVKFFSVALALVSLGCQSTTEPTQIPIQFQSTFGGGPVQQLVISSQSRRIRVVGGYQGGCGDIGAFAAAIGSVVRLTVGRGPDDSPCDAILLTYSYTASLDVPAGMYSVEVFHRRNPWAPTELAGRAEVTVQ